MELLARMGKLSGKLNLSQNENSANKKQLFREWDAISDEEAAVLKSEFAAEDLAFAEVTLSFLPVNFYEKNLDEQ